VSWVVEIGDEFEPEFDALHEDVKAEILALSRGYSSNSVRSWGDPRADTLNGSRSTNMKELCFGAAGGEWRAAFGFDTRQRGSCLWLEISQGLTKDSSTGS